MNKPFNLEHALKHGCQTRDGRKARIICTDRKGNYPVMALVDYGDSEEAFSYTEEGRFSIEDYNDPCDLLNTTQHQ